MFVLYKKQGLCPALPGLANLMLDIIYGYMHNLNILCIGKLLHISYINSLTKFKSSSLKNSLSYNSKLIIFTQQTAKQTLIINNTLSLYFTLKGNLAKLCLYIFLEIATHLSLRSDIPIKIFFKIIVQTIFSKQYNLLNL